MPALEIAVCCLPPIRVECSDPNITAQWRENPGGVVRPLPDHGRGLTPLFWSNVNPYGRFALDMDTHLGLASD